MPYEDYEFHPSKAPQHYPEKPAFEAKLRKRFEEDLLNNPAYDAFFAEHPELPRQLFADRWAQEKTGYLQHHHLLESESYISDDVKLREMCEEFYWLIAQKKLFNLQCLWRAGKISLPGVTHTQQFNYWGHNIRRCPFVDPADEQEIEVLKGFLREHEEYASMRFSMFGYQDYDELTERDMNDDLTQYPDWYEYYDGRMGTGMLLQLPDVIGPIEERYMNATRNKRQQEREEAKAAEDAARLSVSLDTGSDNSRNAGTSAAAGPDGNATGAGSAPQDARNSAQNTNAGATAVPPAPDDAPQKKIMWREPDSAAFVEKFEHSYIKYLYWQHRYLNRPPADPYYNDFLGERARLDLFDSPIEIHSRGGRVWHEEILACAARMQHLLAAEDLEIIHDEYMMLRSLGMTGDAADDDEDNEHWLQLADVCGNMILDGRELLGEPRNFDYLPMP